MESTEEYERFYGDALQVSTKLHIGCTVFVSACALLRQRFPPPSLLSKVRVHAQSNQEKMHSCMHERDDVQSV
jgi:hypothetical protein